MSLYDKTLKAEYAGSYDFIGESSLVASFSVKEASGITADTLEAEVEKKYLTRK